MVKDLSNPTSVLWEWITKALLALCVFFLTQVYLDMKETMKLVSKHDTRIEVLNQKVTYLERTKK